MEMAASLPLSQSSDEWVKDESEDDVYYMVVNDQTACNSTPKKNGSSADARPSTSESGTQESNDSYGPSQINSGDKDFSSPPIKRSKTINNVNEPSTSKIKWFKPYGFYVIPDDMEWPIRRLKTKSFVVPYLQDMLEKVSPGTTTKLPDLSVKKEEWEKLNEMIRNVDRQDTLYTHVLNGVKIYFKVTSKCKRIGFSATNTKFRYCCATPGCIKESVLKGEVWTKNNNVLDIYCNYCKAVLTDLVMRFM